MAAKTRRKPRKRTSVRRKVRSDWRWKLLSLAMALSILAMLFYWWGGSARLGKWIALSPGGGDADVNTERPTVPRFIECMVFFGNSEKDPEGLRCEVVYPVPRRFPDTAAVARTALEELLEGPTEPESEAGYYSNINPGVRLLSVDVIDGVARVDFTSKFDAGTAGACQVEAIRAQIRETLTQFQTVRDVQILVEGEATGVLQP